MAEDHEITTSDGQTFDVTIPDGSSLYDVKHRLEGYLSAQKRVQQHPGAATGMAATGGFLRGMPIAGPTLEAGAQRGAARVRSMITGQPFPEELRSVEEHAKAAEEAHPTAETVGEIGGGLTGYAAAGAAAPELMGLTGGMGRMMTMGGLSGGGISAADALARGQNPLVAGGVGAGAGVAGPVAGRGVGMVAQPFVRAARAAYDPAMQAGRDVASMFRRAGQVGDTTRLGPQEVAAARARGQPVTPMEMGGEPGRALARSAANVSPEARGTLNTAINARYEEQANRFTGWLQQRFHYPNADAQQAALDQVSQTVNKAAYDKAYVQGAGGIWSKDIARHWEDPVVQDAARKAMETVRRDARIHGYQLRPNDTPLTAEVPGPLQFARGPDGKMMVPSLRFWDQVQRNLRDVARAAGPGTHASNQIETVRKALVSDLDTRVPAFGAARAGAAQAFGAENALEAGQAAVTSKMNTRTMRASVAKMTAQEKQLFQDGYIDRMLSEIQNAPDRRNLANHFFNSPAARERLEIAVGPDAAKELEAFTRVEQIMDYARQAVQGNSTTARQLVELGLVGSGTAAGYDIYSGQGLSDPTGVLVGAIFGGLRFGGARAAAGINERVANHVARLLTSQNPADLNRAIRVIAENKNLLGAIKNADAAIGEVVTSGTVPTTLRDVFGIPQREEKPTYGGSIE